jgi:hypothetical protein
MKRRKTGGKEQQQKIEAAYCMQHMDSEQLNTILEFP